MHHFLQKISYKHRFCIGPTSKINRQVFFALDSYNGLFVEFSRQNELLLYYLPFLQSHQVGKLVLNHSIWFEMQEFGCQGCPHDEFNNRKRPLKILWCLALTLGRPPEKRTRNYSAYLLFYQRVPSTAGGHSSENTHSRRASESSTRLQQTSSLNFQRNRHSSLSVEKTHFPPCKLFNVIIFG